MDADKSLALRDKCEQRLAQLRIVEQHAQCVQKTNRVELFDLVRAEHFDIVAEYGCIGSRAFPDLFKSIIGNGNRGERTPSDRAAIAHGKVAHQQTARPYRLGGSLPGYGLVHLLFLVRGQFLAMQRGETETGV